MSFQPGRPRSAYVVRDPSGSRRSRRPSGDETISRPPSGSQAVHSGSDFTRAITSLRPARSTASTSPADQSEKYSRSPCHRGDSTRPRPSSSTFTSFIPVIVLTIRQFSSIQTNGHRRNHRPAPLLSPRLRIVRLQCRHEPFEGRDRGLERGPPADDGGELPVPLDTGVDDVLELGEQFGAVLAGRGTCQDA